MYSHETSDCSDTLLDLLFYEICTKRLSPEIQRLFYVHLGECAGCRRRVLGFRRTLAVAEEQRNFG